MKSLPDDNSREQDDGPKWPWWEPYVFTACLLAAILAALVIFTMVSFFSMELGVFEEVQHILFALVTLAGVVEAIRRSPGFSSLAGKCYAVAFYGLISSTYLVQDQSLLSVAYALQTVIWLGLSINAGVQRHRIREGKLAKLDDAIETLRGSFDKDGDHQTDGENNPGEGKSDIFSGDLS